MFFIVNFTDLENVYKQSTLNTNMFGLAGFGVEFGFLGLICTIFSIIMLVNAIRRKFKDNSEKVIWILAMIFTNFIGALLYYFLVYRKDKKSDPKLLWKIVKVCLLIMLFSVLAALLIFLVNRVILG